MGQPDFPVAFWWPPPTAFAGVVMPRNCWNFTPTSRSEKDQKKHLLFVAYVSYLHQRLTGDVYLVPSTSFPHAECSKKTTYWNTWRLTRTLQNYEEPQRNIIRKRANKNLLIPNKNLRRSRIIRFAKGTVCWTTFTLLVSAYAQALLGHSTRKALRKAIATACIHARIFCRWVG